MIEVASRFSVDSYGVMKIGEKIQKLMSAKGLKQGSIASQVGMDQSHFSKCLKGKNNFSASQTLQLARLLETSFEYLADDSLDDEPPGSEPLTRDEAELLSYIREIGVVAATRRLYGEIRDSSGRLIHTLRPGRREE